MKNKFKIIPLIVFILILAACSEQTVDTISNVEPTEREKTILETTAKHWFLYDFNLQKEYETISVWVERYEFGQLVDEAVAKMTTSMEDSSGSIMFLTPKHGDQSNKIRFNIGIGNSAGTVSSVSTEASEILPSHKLEEASSILNRFPDESMEIKEEMVLATIVYSTAEFGVSSVTTDFYENPTENIDTLAEYDVTYVFKAKFVK